VNDLESRRRALAFNAVAPAVNQAGYWLPLSARRAVADAVLATLNDPDAGYCPDCGRGDAGPTADEYEQQRRRAETAERRTIRIQTLLDEQRDRVRKLADQIALDSPWGRSTADSIRAALGPKEEPK